MKPQIERRQLYTLVNGACKDSLPLLNRGLSYADGLFETIFINANRPEFLPLHLQRLETSCRRLKINCDIPLLKQEISWLLDNNSVEKGVLKIIIVRGYTGWGYQPNIRAASDRILLLSAMPPPRQMSMTKGVAACLCRTRLSINPVLAGMKHLNRLEQVMARSEWQDSRVTEGLMLDTQGYLIEGTQSNVFLLIKGHLKTPSLHRCGVEGIMRAVVMQQLAPQMGIDIHQTDLTVDDLIKADAVFLTNSLIGICPVIKMGCHYKTIDPVIVRLQEALDKLRGQY